MGENDQPQVSSQHQNRERSRLILQLLAALRGLTVAILSFIHHIDLEAAVGMLGLGVAALAVSLLPAN